MKSAAGPLAPSESKMRFMTRLGLDLENLNDKRLYKAMKSDAVAVYLEITGQRDALLPQLQADLTVVAPYTYAQVSETALHRAKLGMYARANSETRVYYDLGRNTAGIEEENWVIRWLLWHVFRYRDRRNRNGLKDNGKASRSPSDHNDEDDSDGLNSLNDDCGHSSSMIGQAGPHAVPLHQGPQRRDVTRLPYDPARDM